MVVSTAQFPDSLTTGAVRGRLGGRGILGRYSAGLLGSWTAAGIDVIVIVRLLTGNDLNLLAAVGLVVAGTAADLGVAAKILRPTLAWWASGQPASPTRCRQVIALPARQIRLHAGIWAAVGAGMLAAHHAAGARTLTIIAVAVILGAAATCCMGYLLAERALRPVLAAALVNAAPPANPRRVVGVRMLVTWALSTVIPLLGIATIAGAHLVGWPIRTTVDTSTSVLFLVVMGVVAGLRGMTLAARSVSDPVHDVASAMRRIGNGHFDTRVETYDTSEIGTLQTGFNEMAIGLVERERMHDLFGRHVGRDVARHALEEGVALTGRVCVSAILFIDLAGSTAFAARNPPHRVAGLLNTFFALVVDTVDHYHGVVNKFEGDAALVIFGAPLPHQDPAGAALACARDLSTQLAARTDMLDFGIGVAHGSVFAGNIGAEDRYEYTVIGDAVNEAARLSDLAKTRPRRVLASAAAVSSAATDESVHWSSGEEVRLRGRTAITVIAEPRAEPI